MGFAERRPRGRLQGVIERLWLVDDPSPSGEPDVICPDGTMEIVLHLGDPMRQQADAGRDGVSWSAAGAAPGDYVQPHALLVGQMDRPIVIAPTGSVSMVGARFAPGAFHRLLPMPQHRLAGQVHDLAAVWGAWTRNTRDRVASVTSGDARLNVFEDALEDLVPDTSDPADLAWRRVIRRLRATAGQAPIALLAREAGIGRRQFERRFQDHVGLPPRLFGRILRFQQAFEALGQEPGAMVAARCGYADQAHLIREIRRFAGQTPRALTHAGGLTAFFKT